MALANWMQGAKGILIVPSKLSGIQVGVDDIENQNHCFKLISFILFALRAACVGWHLQNITGPLFSPADTRMGKSSFANFPSRFD